MLFVNTVNTVKYEKYYHASISWISPCFTMFLMFQVHNFVHFQTPAARRIGGDDLLSRLVWIAPKLGVSPANLPY